VGVRVTTIITTIITTDKYYLVTGKEDNMAKNKKTSMAQRKENTINKKKQLMLNNEIYIISVDEQGTPFLVNNQYLLLYFKKESADEAAQGFCKLYGDGKILAFKIENNIQFFEMMWNCGIPEFILNGDSNIYNIGTYFKLSKKPTNMSKGLEIKNQQPVRIGKFSLRKNIKIKEWFSVFSNISLACGLGLWIMTFIFNVIIKQELEYDFVSSLRLFFWLFFFGGGIISGFVAVIGARNSFVKSEQKTIFGIILSLLGVYSPLLWS